MNFFISEQRIKEDILADNVSSEYLRPAMITAQTIFLKDTIGDSLYSAIDGMIGDGTITGTPYEDLVNSYIIPYLEFAVMGEICVPMSFKLRNMGMIRTYDSNASDTSLSETKYIKKYYDERAEFYRLRLVKFLNRNASDFPEWSASCECGDITPARKDSITNITGIYLG